MQKRNLFVAVLAICFGGLVFFTSLLMYSQKQDIGGGTLTSRKFYVNEKILPDNVLYPFLMILDRGLLGISKGESEVYFRIRLAQDRLLSAHKLLEKGEEQLALSTVTKSQKYLILACSKYLENEDTYSLEAGKAVHKALLENTRQLTSLESQFTKISTNPITDLIVESNSLIAVIENKVE